MPNHHDALVSEETVMAIMIHNKSGALSFNIEEGIVNLTRVWQTGQHEKANTQLPTSPFSL
jgi:hypothetical protein